MGTLVGFLGRIFLFPFFTIFSRQPPYSLSFSHADTIPNTHLVLLCRIVSLHCTEVSADSLEPGLRLSGNDVEPGLAARFQPPDLLSQLGSRLPSVFVAVRERELIIQPHTTFKPSHTSETVPLKRQRLVIFRFEFSALNV